MAHPSPAIEDHGLIGDLRTAALVDRWGSLNFLCWPRFDSPTVFASLLDPDGGSFRIDADVGEDARRKQIYLPDTNVLLTRVLTEEAVAEITDLMPKETDQPQVLRIVRCLRGVMDFSLRCAPRFDYARSQRQAILSGAGHEVCFGSGDDPFLRLVASVPLQAEGSDAVASFRLRQGEIATFVLAASPPDDGADDPLSRDVAAHCTHAFDSTVAYWRRWIGRSTYRGRAREMVNRSALVLKLMNSEEFGSIVAAPTFGLPEVLGGSRNWDYRYTWVRDAAFTLYAFIRLGFTEEATSFMGWIYGRVEDSRLTGREDGTLQIMYGLDGRAELPETNLDHLAGYAGSRPVRIGNAAYEQLQLDSYGALMDAVYLANKYGTPISYDGWQAVTRTVDWVCANWRQPDEGIWEVRGGRQEFLSSRLMCWVAVDRALRMAGKFSLPAPFARWQEVRNEIHHSVYEDFWDDGLRAFVQAKGHQALDASCLLMPLVRFISPTDPRWLSTLDAVGTRLANDALVRRYDVQDSADADGLEGVEGSFTVCSFWYVECLARAGRIDEAQLMFDKLVSYANHLGLYAEELGPAGDHLGNFPQALTHLALISAAVALDRALEGQRTA